MSWFKQAPWTCGLALLALLVWIGRLEAGLFLDLQAVAAGEVWRLLTGHVAHLNHVHLAWNLLPFVILGLVYEPRFGAARYAALLGAGVVLVDLVVLSGVCGVTFYAGLSGVATTVFVAGALSDLQESRLAVDRLGIALALLALTGIGAKLVYEFATSKYFFLQGRLPGMAVPAVHLAGALAGVALSALLLRQAQPEEARA